MELKIKGFNFIGGGWGASAPKLPHAPPPPPPSTPVGTLNINVIIFAVRNHNDVSLVLLRYRVIILLSTLADFPRVIMARPGIGIVKRSWNVFWLIIFFFFHFVMYFLRSGSSGPVQAL